MSLNNLTTHEGLQLTPLLTMDEKGEGSMEENTLKDEQCPTTLHLSNSFAPPPVLMN